MTTCVENHMRESLDGHEITTIHQSQQIWPLIKAKDPLIRAFWMRRPTTYMPKAQQGFYSALVIFSPLGITIGGDLRIGNQVSVSSAPGYSEDWFGGKLDEGYLCGKFNLDLTFRPAKSRRAELVKSSCGWLCATQQRFQVLYEAMVEKGVVKP